MSLLTSFYKKLMTIKFFRDKAKARLVSSVFKMDTPIQKISEGKRAWLLDAQRNKDFKLKAGLYKADLMLNNEVLPECEFNVYLEIQFGDKFKCVRKFKLDDIELEHTWEGSFKCKGAYLLMDTDFYFRETKILTSTTGDGFNLKISPSSGPNIYFERLNKKNAELYKAGLLD